MPAKTNKRELVQRLRQEAAARARNGTPPQPPPDDPSFRPPQQSYLAVVEQVYHQPTGAQPTAVPHSWGRELTTDAQPYQRRIRVGPDWKPLDLGWLVDEGGVGLVILANQAGQFPATVPSPQEREAVRQQVVEIGVEADCLDNRGEDGTRVVTYALLRPGESNRYEPADATAVRLRCPAGEVAVSLTLLPR